MIWYVLLTETRECNESGDHEDGMQVELLLDIVVPGESVLVHNHPVNGQDEGANQKDRWYDHNE